MRAVRRNRWVVFGTVAQQLAALGAIEEDACLVDSGLGQSVVSGTQY